MAEKEQPDLAQVAELERRATELKRMLEQRSAERPLIIEFSGSPKAGKTRSISVLELFLKRNGISVEVFTERASIAPIKSKGHLNFNVWVSCASLQGMLESLYRDVDVFILDRGIFDALVWNEWLEATGKITNSEARQLEQFFTMDRWTELVDVVFVLTCTPSVSIDREYIDQLTTRRGTIMSEDTLRQFLEATERTVQKFESKFKKIVQIDTTTTKPREGVAKITDEALKVLDEFLDESLCVLPTSALSVTLPDSGFISSEELINGFVNAVDTKKTFMPRSKAEVNPNVLQPIPCALLRYKDKLLLLRRRKPGHPLHDKYAIWAGGHAVQSDRGPNSLLSTLERELSEEVFIKGAYSINEKPIGLLRTNEDARASRHIGVLYELTLTNADVALAMNQKEFRSTRGRSMSGKLVSIPEIRDLYDEMGDWSKSILDQLWPAESPRRPGEKTQPQLFQG